MRRWSISIKEMRVAAHLQISASVIVLSALLVMAFYSTPMRDQMENLLYDLRTQLKPDREPLNDVLVIGIPDPAVDPAEREDAVAQSRLAFADMGAVVGALSSTNARLIGALLFPNIFDYESGDAGLFAVSVAQDPRVVIGTMGLDTEFPSVRKTPNQFSLVSDRLFGLETFRSRRHQTIRRMPYNGYRGMTPMMLFPLAMATKLRGEYFKSTILRQLSAINWQVEWFQLNYVRVNAIPFISSDEFLALPLEQRNEWTRDRVVLVAPLYYRERLINNDQIFANTPWQREGDDPIGGRSLAWIHANAIMNLLHDRVIKQPARVEAWIVAQSLVMAILSGFVWQWGIAFAVLSLTVGWGVFLVVQASIIAEWSIIVPIADTVLFSSVATMLGCLWRIQHEGMLKVRERLSSEARQEVARVQSRFLDDFATELLETNQSILELAEQLKLAFPVLDHQLLDRFRISSQEFDEYLRSIRDFAGSSVEHSHRVRRDRIKVCSLVERVVKHFELKCSAEQVRVQIAGDAAIEVRTDERMLEAIVFNFVSNAVKYSPRGGLITVAVTRNGTRCRIAVTDVGPGIPPEFQERIFEKFYRVRDDRNVAIKGNGLGLYLVRYFAELIGGQVTVASEVGKGSTFAVELKG
jgi:signal transduction histidine kinase